MAGLEVVRMHLFKTGRVEVLNEEHEHMQVIRPGIVTAFLVLQGVLAEFIRELVHQGPPGYGGVSTLSRGRSSRGRHAWPRRPASATAPGVSRPRPSCGQRPRLGAAPSARRVE